MKTNKVKFESIVELIPKAKLFGMVIFPDALHWKLKNIIDTSSAPPARAYWRAGLLRGSSLVIKLINFFFIAFVLFIYGQEEYCFSQDLKIKVGAERTEIYIPKLTGQNVGIVANSTSLIKNIHIVDSLTSSGINIVKIFTPEHGFKGTSDAGEYFSDTVSSINNIKIISLYNNKKKPTAEDLKNINIMVFDIQDVGVRFYTYISTLHYVMEACAEENIPLLILDRPNPNGYYVDGPVLQLEYRSFVGLHPVPVVYGMTIAEYAKMINGEKWLKDGISCSLDIVPCENYEHTYYYELPVNPSPNIQKMRAVYLYPSLGFFEGTIINVGRGTDFPFHVYGHPDFPDKSFHYMPKTNPGAKEPKHKNMLCYGVDLSNIKIDAIQPENKINLSYIISAYEKMNNHKDFFNNYFNYLAGNDILKEQIIDGLTEEQIRSSWQNDISHFKTIRKKYLLYTDFE